MTVITSLPPQHKANRIDWETYAQEARENPGSWSRVEKPTSAGQVDHIKKGRIKAFQPAGHYDATSRDPEIDRLTGQKRVTVYVKYIGKEDDGFDW